MDLEAEEADLLRELARRRRAPLRIGCLVAIGLAVVLTLAAGICDRYWGRKLEAKLERLRADGQLLTVDEMVSQHNYLPDGENSALAFRDARTLVQQTDQGYLAGRCLEQSPLGTLPSESVQEWLRADLEANAEALRLMHEAAGLPRGSYPVEPAPDPWGFRMLEVQGFRGAGQLCSREALWRAVEGDASGAARSLVTCRRLAASMGERPFFIEALVRMAVDRIMIAQLERVAGLCEMGEEELGALIQGLDLEEAELSLDWSTVAARSESARAMAHPDALSEMRSGRSLPLLYGWVPGWRERDILYFHEVMDRYSELAGLAPREKATRGEEVSEALDEELSASKGRHPLAALVLPTMGAAFCAEAHVKAHLRVARTALQVEKWRTEHGRWPDSLDEVVPGVWEAPPGDPFSEAPLVYRRTDDGMVVYSVGADGADDGGLSEEEARRLAGDDLEEGWDLTFRLLDPELRGARQAAFRDEVMQSIVTLGDLSKVGLDADELKALGLSLEDLGQLRQRP